MTDRGPGVVGLLRLGARALRRDMRNPHLVVVAVALVIAVAGMTAVGTFTDRVQRALTAQAGSLLAADLALQSSRPLPENMRARATADGLHVSEQVNMRSMVSHADGLQMVELKAVDGAYPLRGEVQVILSGATRPGPLRAGPGTGEVWVESRLLGLLSLQVGEVLKIGAATLRIAGVLALEPDRAGDLFSIAPRVMMNLADLPATRLILPGSRLQYTLSLAGTDTAVEAFAKHARDLARPNGFRVVSPDEARPEVRSALDHARQFLSLAALVATTLAGLAILVAAHSFAREQVDTIAIWRTLGATRSTLGWLHTSQVVLLGLLASMVGAAVGSGLEFGLSRALAGLVQGEMPPASLRPALTGIAAGVLALMGFALPQLLALREVSPARVLRRDLPWRGPGPGMIAGGALASIGLLAPWQSGDLQLTLWALGGLSGCLLLLFGCGRGALWLLDAWLRRRTAWWLTGFTNLTRRPGLVGLQVCALGMSLAAITLLGLVRSDLVANWTESLPPDAPDQFLINIEPEEVSALEAFLTGEGIRLGGVWPMVRARLVSINDRPVQPEDFTDPRARRLADREFNLSTADELKHDNRLVAGKFWQAGENPAQFSFEIEIARTLGIELGDTVSYRIADRLLTGKVTSLRAVNWETMEANFFVVSPTAFLEGYPATHITSFKLPEAREDILKELSARHPSVTVIDVQALLRQVRGVMDRALAAIEFVFFFTLAASVVVVFAAVEATHGERLHDVTVMKTLGATRDRILAVTSLEFASLGALAGVIGTVAASLGAWWLATRLLNMEYHFNGVALLLGAGLGTLAVWLAGLRAVVGAWRQPVAEVLREWS